MNEFSQLNLTLVLNSVLVKSIDQIRIEGVRLFVLLGALVHEAQVTRF